MFTIEKIIFIDSLGGKKKRQKFNFMVWWSLPKKPIEIFAHFRFDSKTICFYTLLKELFTLNAGKRVPFHEKFNENNTHIFPTNLLTILML